MEMIFFYYMLENSSQFFWGVLRGVFQGFGCPKRHPDALLTKTMVLPKDVLLINFITTNQQSLRHGPG